MKRTNAILSAGLLSTGVLLAGCAVDVANGASNQTPTAATAEVGQALISYDPATSTYRIESGTLDRAGFPYTVEFNQEVRGTLKSPDDVLEVKGVAAEAQIAFLSKDAATAKQGPPERLGAGESVDLNSTCYVPGPLEDVGDVLCCWHPNGAPDNVLACVKCGDIYKVLNWIPVPCS